jgi:uncharacterized membrane protein (UPF0127 family)
MPDRVSLIDADSGNVIVEQLELATTFWRRFRGLQLRRELPRGSGLLLVPCRSIHTHWMRFAVDVAMIGDDGITLAVETAVPPWRMLAGPQPTHAVLETAAGELTERLAVGHRVAVRGGNRPLFRAANTSERRQG